MQAELFNLDAYGDITRNRNMGNAESVEANDRVAPHKHRQREEIIALLRAFPLGLTVQEIADRLAMPYQSASGRASELKRDGLVVPSGRRRETTTGGKAAVLVVSV